MPDQDAPPATTLQQWQNLKTQAENGELRMEEGIATQLAGRCNTFVDRLDEMLRTAEHLGTLSGFGTLRTAEALRDKLARKGVGDPDSAANRLKAAIDIVSLMKETFELAGRRIEETDQSTSSALGNAGA
ncbi:hypothetical protein [Nocardia carnea]|uniref:hypothetical protein n=1 Tax=Nocardia carnea TaxID=37328 RepID=UPI002458DDFB|nr:hypothetical protein [Nocardia carnea]